MSIECNFGEQAHRNSAGFVCLCSCLCANMVKTLIWWKPTSKALVSGRRSINWVLHADPYRWLFQASLKNLKEGNSFFFYNSSFLGTHPLYRATSSTKEYSSPLWQTKTSHKRDAKREDKVTRRKLFKLLSNYKTRRQRTRKRTGKEFDLANRRTNRLIPRILTYSPRKIIIIIITLF